MPIWVAIIIKTEKSKCWWGHGEIGILTSCCGMQNGLAPVETIPWLKSSHTEYLCDSASRSVPLKNENKPSNTCSCIFAAKEQKEPRCPLKGAGMSKSWCMRTAEHHSVIQSPEGKGVEHMLQCRWHWQDAKQRSQTQNDTYCTVLFIWNIPNR